MQTVFMSTYGCQMNVNDSERMLSLLEMMNYEQVMSAEQASLIIINSCSIREKAVHKVRSEVGRYRLLKAKKPHVKIGVAGCVAQQEKQKLLEKIPLLDFVLGTDAIDELPQIVLQLKESSAPIVSAKPQNQKPYQVETLVRNPGVSTFVNITKGCDNFCTFCIVPYTRGRERSREASEVILDVQNLCRRGVKEVTLLGQNVNSYQSGNVDFAKLLEKVCLETEIERVRFTTSHPKDFDEELVQIMAKHRAKICDYIHLPAQSGSSEILAKMNRGYTREEYLQKVAMIQNLFKGVALSTDIIVGFPGETDQQFEETLELITEVGYDTLFAFKYSPRPFTKAAQFSNPVPEEIKSLRLERLLELHHDQALKKVKAYEGQTVFVLVESFDEKTQKLSGRCTQNKLVHFLGSPTLIGQTVPVRILQAFPATLRGEWVH